MLAWAAPLSSARLPGSVLCVFFYTGVGVLCHILSQLPKLQTALGPYTPPPSPTIREAVWSGVNFSMLLRAQQRCLHLPAGSGAWHSINYSLRGRDKRNIVAVMDRNEIVFF